jgi:hypothetical protein
VGGIGTADRRHLLVLTGAARPLGPVGAKLSACPRAAATASGKNQRQAARSSPGPRASRDLSLRPRKTDRVTRLTWGIRPSPGTGTSTVSSPISPARLSRPDKARRRRDRRRDRPRGGSPRGGRRPGLGASRRLPRRCPPGLRRPTLRGLSRSGHCHQPSLLTLGSRGIQVSRGTRHRLDISRSLGTRGSLGIRGSPLTPDSRLDIRVSPVTRVRPATPDSSLRPTPGRGRDILASPVVPRPAPGTRG